MIPASASNEAEGKLRFERETGLIVTDNVAAIPVLIVAMRQPLSVGYDAVKAINSHAALLAENAALQRQLELAEATHGDEAFAGALSDELAKSRQWALAARNEKLMAVLEKFVAYMESDSDGGEGLFEEFMERLMPEAKAALVGNS